MKIRKVLRATDLQDFVLFNSINLKGNYEIHFTARPPKGPPLNTQCPLTAGGHIMPRHRLGVNRFS